MTENFWLSTKRVTCNLLIQEGLGQGQVWGKIKILIFVHTEFKMTIKHLHKSVWKQVGI